MTTESSKTRRRVVALLLAVALVAAVSVITARFVLPALDQHLETIISWGSPAEDTASGVYWYALVRETRTRTIFGHHSPPRYEVLYVVAAVKPAGEVEGQHGHLTGSGPDLCEVNLYVATDRAEVSVRFRAENGSATLGGKPVDLTQGNVFFVGADGRWVQGRLAGEHESEEALHRVIEQRAAALEKSDWQVR
ncbi:MAG: hypothetical protein HS108_11875 [Planctomycetes bacterium]|jgi:hypothetical protein|nr:hypothetical protein [Planctomycetota bacterium]MCL4729742.1 hypothetical protein [Planctomycetota bacterium]